MNMIRTEGIIGTVTDWWDDDQENRARCQCVCVMADDRWGHITQQCRRVEGHAGPHMEAFNACMPLAVLSWFDDGESWWRGG